MGTISLNSLWMKAWSAAAPPGPFAIFMAAACIAWWDGTGREAEPPAGDEAGAAPG